MKVKITSDSTCDLSKEIRDYFGVVDYIKGHVHINGKSITTSLDWDNISRKEFYNTLSNKKNEVNSAAASPEEYYETFKKYIIEGGKRLEGTTYVSGSKNA